MAPPVAPAPMVSAPVSTAPVSMPPANGTLVAVSVGALRGGLADAVREDIVAVVDTAHLGGAIVKVILETALLTDEQKVQACRLAVAAGADFVKTSTGFAASGATAEDIALMRRTVGPNIGVKASGGVRTLRPPLPAVTCTAQSTMLTGLAPSGHGIVGNGWHDRALGEVQFWKQSNRLVSGEKVWETARRIDPSFTCANACWWYAMQIGRAHV